MKISNDIRYIGVNDHEIDLFEGQYHVPNGMSYNSYLILDQKTAVTDTVDARFIKQWLENIETQLQDKAPDYLIISHMEPDHSANINAFMEKFPTTTIVATAKAFTMMLQFFGTDYAERRLVVGDGDTLCLGKHTLTFYTAAMVHWPEVVTYYDDADKVYFSADAFGKFGALDIDEKWEDEARRYYIGIVGKYGAQVQALFKKVASLDIKTICPLHGPVLTENLSHYLGLYNTWSSYTPEEDGILIAYTSVYGNTKNAALLLSDKLIEKGCKNVVVHDLARTDMSAAVADAFRLSKTVLATTTYNADIFPFMREFIEHLTERNFGNRTLALIENGSWAPMAAKVMKSLLEKSKNITYVEPIITVKSAMNDAAKQQIDALADVLCQ